MLKTPFGRFILVLGLGLIAYLQYLFWFGEGGYHDRQKLKEETSVLQTEVTSLQERNRALAAEVNDLKNGLEAVEEYARLDLGLIKQGEMFIQKSTFIAPKPSAMTEFNNLTKPQPPVTGTAAPTVNTNTTTPHANQ